MLVKVKPTSPGRRTLVKVVTPGLHKGKPVPALVEREPQHLRVDGAPVDRFGPDVSRPLTVVFLPERLELVRGGPSLRRAHQGLYNLLGDPSFVVTPARGV